MATHRETRTLALPSEWLFDIVAPDSSALLDVAGYHQHLADNWEKTQRLIKGKINREED